MEEKQKKSPESFLSLRKKKKTNKNIHKEIKVSETHMKNITAFIFKIGPYSSLIIVTKCLQARVITSSRGGWVVSKVEAC